MNTATDITTLINQNLIGRRQWMILILCGICMILDGFDVQSIGYVAPALLDSWHIDRVLLTPVFSAGLGGLLLGSLVFSLMSDKLGRRPALIFATPFVKNVTELAFIRFLAGLGLGAIMPTAMTLCGEYSPRRHRIMIMMMISCGFTVGAMLGGVVAAELIPRFGWESVFYVGGIIPVLIVLLMLWYLPESLQLMVIKGRNPELINRHFRKTLPHIALSEDIALTSQPEQSQRMPVVALFHEGRSLMTVMLWVISFLNLIALYFLSSWLPTLSRLSGLSLEQAVLLGSTLQLGGTAGTIVLGLLIDKRGFHRILPLCFLSAALAIAMIGRSEAIPVLLFCVVFVAGFTVIGAQPAINAMAANFYPTSLRATGTGWCLGVGRLGSVVGPMLGGLLIQLNWSYSALFTVIALPSLFVMTLLYLARQSATTQPQI